MHHDARFVTQLAVILIAAKLLGRLCEKYLKQPSVVGEIIAGVVIGPFALGGVPIPGYGPLFPVIDGGAIHEGMQTVAIVAAVVLLFLAGLESDLKKFLRYAATGVVTGLGGAVLSFFLGTWVTVCLGGATGFTDPKALFMGTVATATSVGLTARVLADRRKMDTSEGAVIVSAAVVDDVIGLILLAVVLSLAARQDQAGAGIPWGQIGRIVAKALGAWVVLLTCAILLGRRLSSFLKFFGGIEASTAVALGMALFVAGLAETAGMALIIGAYIAGLGLSRADLRHELEHALATMYQVFVPVFFCIAGMMVDLFQIRSVLLFAIAFTVVAIVGKVVGCGIPALPMGFNLRGALRIGLGMAPRMEVALIVAGVAVQRGAVDSDMMGVVILMVMATAIGTPPILWRLFGSRSGRRADADEEPEEMLDLKITLAGAEVARLVLRRMVDAFREEQFYSYRLPTGIDMFEFRKNEHIVYARVDGDNLVLSARPASMQYIRFIVLEELLELERVFSEIAKVSDMDLLRRSLWGLENHEVKTPG